MGEMWLVIFDHKHVSPVGLHFGGGAKPHYVRRGNALLAPWRGKNSVRRLGSFRGWKGSGATWPLYFSPMSPRFSPENRGVGVGGFGGIGAGGLPPAPVPPRNAGAGNAFTLCAPRCCRGLRRSRNAPPSLSTLWRNGSSQIKGRQRGANRAQPVVAVCGSLLGAVALARLHGPSAIVLIGGLPRLVDCLNRGPLFCGQSGRNKAGLPAAARVAL